MNYGYYNALLLTSSFFKLFKNIKYKHVPVARAMAYSFHRKAVKYYAGKGIRESKNWEKNIITLYSTLIKSDQVVPIKYKISSKKRGKIIFSPYAIEGLNFNLNEVIILGANRQELNRVKGISSVLPSMLNSFNERAYKRLLKQAGEIVQLASTPEYFKRKAFILWFAKQLKLIIKTIDGIETIFKQNRIIGIVQHSSVHPLGYLLVHMGKQRKIPTINLQYGLNDDYQLFSTYVDYYIAWGETHKKRLEKFGVPKNKIYLLGNARFDPVFKGRWKDKKQLAKILKFPADKIVFFYPDQPITALRNKKVMEAILKALLPYRNKVILIVKDHPRQKQSSLPPSYTKKYPFVRKIKNHKVRLYDLINSSDAIFVQFSTVGIESLLMKTPILVVSLFPNTNKHEYAYYTSSRYITAAKSEKQLKKLVKKFVAGSSYRKAILKKESIYLKKAYNGSISRERIKKFIMQKTK